MHNSDGEVIYIRC